MKGRILLVDDEENLRTLLTKILSLEEFEVLEVGDCKTALKKLDQTNIDIVLCDVKLPDGNGVDLSKKIKDKYPLIEIILLTAYGNIPDGVRSIKNGAFDYITKGDDNNKIIPLLYLALEKIQLSKKTHQLEKQLQNTHSFDSIIGTSESIKNVIEKARRVSSTDATVLLTGETGTGKEVFAQAIHQESHRQKNNFIAVNCSAFSKDLLENELFGHKAGSFTGAVKDTKGIFEEANHGTIFLDEIGELPLELQAKLLRVLETGEFLKIGESKITKVDVRIIAATNRDLQKEIEIGRFREDLFYRISVFQILLPPLRERLLDIEQLTNHFLNFFVRKTNKKIDGVTKSYLNSLLSHQWKGNIRELKNILERSVILTDIHELDVDTLPMDFQTQISSTNVSTFNLSFVEKIHIQKVLQYTHGNKAETARLLNIALTTLYRKLSEYHLE